MLVRGRSDSAQEGLGWLQRNSAGSQGPVGTNELSSCGPASPCEWSERRAPGVHGCHLEDRVRRGLEESSCNCRLRPAGVSKVIQGVQR